MEYFVADVARLAPPLTVEDYRASLKAMYPIDEMVKMAREELPETVKAYRSRCIDFFFFLQSPPRTSPDPSVVEKLDAIARSFSLALRLEHAMLRFFCRPARRSRKAEASIVAENSLGTSRQTVKLGKAA